MFGAKLVLGSWFSTGNVRSNCALCSFKVSLSKVNRNEEHYLESLLFRHPHLKVKIFASIFLTSFLICAFITYINDLEPIVIVPPEIFKNRFSVMSQNEKNYFDVYIMPSYMNFGTYFTGFLLAFYYFEFRKNGRIHNPSFLYQLLFYAALPGSFFLLNKTYRFYVYDYDRSSIWLILLSSLIKHHSAIVFGILFMGFVWKYGGVLLNIFNVAIFRVLGRISYSTYIVHMVLVRLLIAGNYYPIHFSMTNLVS